LIDTNNEDNKTTRPDLYIKIGSVCPSVCATVSASINPLPSDRLRCCDRYIRCQRSLAVKPLNSRPAARGLRVATQYGGKWAWLAGRGYCTASSWAQRAVRFHWGLSMRRPWLRRPGGRALDCGLWLACAALLRLTPQATIARSAIVTCFF